MISDIIQFYGKVRAVKLGYQLQRSNRVLWPACVHQKAGRFVQAEEHHAGSEHEKSLCTDNVSISIVWR